jgi:DNA-binding NarL/FixJ family response regulator
MAMSEPIADLPDRAIRVLIVEDHPVLRGVVRLACEHTPGLEVAGEVDTGEAALEAFHELRPDVVVLDLLLPGELQGMDVMHAIRAEGATKILVLTGSTDEQTIFEAIRTGADGYLEKTAGVRFVAEALLRVGAGERVFTREQERVAVSELGRMARQARESSDIRANLTEREVETLQMVADGFTVKQVASRLQLSPRTVETHLSNLYRKIGARNRVQAVARASALGIIELS